MRTTVLFTLATLICTACAPATVSEFRRRGGSETGVVTMPLCGVCAEASSQDFARAWRAMKDRCYGDEPIVEEEGVRNVGGSTTTMMPAFGMVYAYSQPTTTREAYWVFRCQ